MLAECKNNEQIKRSSVEVLGTVHAADCGTGVTLMVRVEGSKVPSAVFLCVWQISCYKWAITPLLSSDTDTSHPLCTRRLRSTCISLLVSGMLVESSSPWASGIMLVQKKDGRLRFYAYYLQLNQRTVLDRYALPRIDGIIDHLLGGKVLLLFGHALR